MSERDATVGQVLREAREAQGLKVEDVSARLRLMHRQIEAMEADDFESLGRPVFARGFVRNYARLLDVDPDTLLAQMEGPRTEPATVRRPEPPPPRSPLTSPWLIVVLLGLLLAVAAPVVLYWWLNTGEEDVAEQIAPSVQVEPIKLDVPGAEAVALGATVPETPATPPADAAVTEPPAAPAAEQAPAAPVEPASPAAEGPSGALHFEFSADSWVEVRDGTGRTVHRQLNPAGSSVDVRGQPPFELVIGNAADTRMTYNGRPIDLKPFIGLTVARFTLEE